MFAITAAQKGGVKHPKSGVKHNMAARVIHIGVDACYRLNVLRRAGYDVDVCGNLLQFGSALHSHPEADAVMLNDGDGSVPLEATSLTRSTTSAPIVLFANSARTYSVEGIDLMVPCFTRAEAWLVDLADLIVRSRAVRACSQLLREKSELLRRESAAVREQSRQERERSGRLRRCNLLSGLRGEGE